MKFVSINEKVKLLQTLNAGKGFFQKFFYFVQQDKLYKVMQKSNQKNIKRELIQSTGEYDPFQYYYTNRKGVFIFDEIEIEKAIQEIEERLDEHFK